MANPNPKTDHLKHKLTRKEQSMGGKASQKKQKERKSFRQAIEWLVNSDIKITKGTLYDVFKNYDIDISQFDTTQLATIGLWFGAVQGNATNFKTLMEANQEIEGDNPIAPILKIEVVDNSSLEKTLYEENRHNKNDEEK